MRCLQTLKFLPHTDNASQIFNLYLILMPQIHHSQIHEINIFYLKKKKNP